MKISVRSTRATHRGFTIVELLTVVAIIMILVAMATPVFVATRKVAITSRCADNQAAIGQAVTMFCMDNHGNLPTTVGMGERADNWVFWEPGRNMDQSALAPYMNARGYDLKRMFICPAQSLEDQVGFQGGGSYPLTYSMNYSVDVYFPLRLSSVKNAQQKVLVYDENQNADDDQFWYGTDRDTLAGRHGVADYQNANIDGTGEQGYVRGLGNVLFLDGHVNLVDNNYCHQSQYNDLNAP